MRFRLAITVAGLVVVAGCAAHQPATLSDQFVRQGEPAMHLGDKNAVTPPEESLEAFIEKARQAQLAARPPAATAATSIEASNPELAVALVRETAMPGPDSSIAVGDIYRRLGLLDVAMGRYTRAVRIDPTRADAYDRMARIWRDWGFSNLGLGDAYRAVYYAPRSPAAQNTLGTLLQQLGQVRAAREAYERALNFDSQAAYAWSNLCSAFIVEGRPHDALAPCRRAVELDPGLRSAQANLATALRLDEGPGH